MDVLRLAKRQLDLDRKRTKIWDGLFEHKLDRMRASPLAFLRGTAPFYYDLLRSDPQLAAGPPGEGWLTGDLHLENFGAYRPDVLGREDAHSVVFDLNDFDDAFIGPWRYDVMRVLVSLILGGRELRVRGAGAVELCDILLDAYVKHASKRQALPPRPKPIEQLVEGVRIRSREELLEARTRVVHGGRRFVRGDRYREIPAKLRKDAEGAFARYVEKLADRDEVDSDHYEVLDVAQRIAGTGSLGVVRLAVLVRGKGGPDGAWVFDMKEEGTPSASVIVTPPSLKPAKRVATAMRACLEHPPKMLDTTKLGKYPLLVRRLMPQEDKLDLVHLKEDDLGPIAAYLGALTGAAHRRGATRPAKRPWSREEKDALLDRAIAIAGAYEAAYLAYFRMCR
jgi:uncharacterized protein (DUF2252 family)